MRKSFVLILILPLMLNSTGCSQKHKNNGHDDQAMIGQMNALEDEARLFEEKGDFESAIGRYKMACEVAIQIYGSDKGRSLAFLARVYQKQGRYEEALPIVKSLLEFHPGQENYQDWVPELEALIQYKKTDNPQRVRDYIQSYINKHQAGLPPVKTDIDAVSKMTRVMALYDMIGDPESGVRYIDMVLDFLYKTNPRFKVMKTSEEAIRESKNRDTAESRSNRRGYEVLAEFLKVREAFEHDKANGTKGSASMALIRSDYFPW